MNKKILAIFLILAFISIIALNSVNIAGQDFDGNFKMNVPFGQHYRNISYCLPNGALGCSAEYWASENDDCLLDGDDIAVYYYNNSCLVDGEANAFNHAIGALTGSYLYKIDHEDGDLVILTNDLGMRNVPPYLVGKTNDDGSIAVFVGGFHLDDLKKYANSIEFTR